MSEKTKIFICEDDKSIIKSLKQILENEDYKVITAMNQKDGIEVVENEQFDLAILDVSLPDGSGYAVCSAIKSNMDVPVIFLTAADDEINVVTGFNVGADDYLAKPFRPLELASRLKNLLRRYGKTNSIFDIGDLRVDSMNGKVMKNGKEVILSALEYRLLLIFLNNKNTVFSRNQLLSKIWDISGDFVTDNTLTVYIKRLRDKIEDDPQDPKIILTVRGMGYKLGI